MGSNPIGALELSRVFIRYQNLRELLIEASKLYDFSGCVKQLIYFQRSNETNFRFCFIWVECVH